MGLTLPITGLVPSIGSVDPLAGGSPVPPVGRNVT